MMRITSDEDFARSMRCIALPVTQREEIHSIVLSVTQREEMYPEDENIGPQAGLNISTTRKG